MLNAHCIFQSYYDRFLLLPKNRIIYNETDFCSYIQNLNYDTNAVAFSSDLCLLSYNLEHSQNRLTSTKDRLYMHSPTFLFRKTSPLPVEFNKHLQSLQETGLIQYWTDTYIDTRKSNAKREPTKLEMKSVWAAFKICGVMYIVSFIVFIFELLSMRLKYFKSFIDYLTYWFLHLLYDDVVHSYSIINLKKSDRILYNYRTNKNNCRKGVMKGVCFIILQFSTYHSHEYTMAKSIVGIFARMYQHWTLDRIDRWNQQI